MAMGQGKFRLYLPVCIATKQINPPSPLIKESKTKLTIFQPGLTNFELYFVKKAIYDSLMVGLFPGYENSTSQNDSRFPLCLSVLTLALASGQTLKENTARLLH